MAKVRIFYNPDNSFSVAYFNFNLQLTGESDVVFMDRMSTKITLGLPSFDIEDTALPDRDETTRNNWRANSGAGTVSAS